MLEAELLEAVSTTEELEAALAVAVPGLEAELQAAEKEAAMPTAEELTAKLEAAELAAEMQAM